MVAYSFSLTKVILWGHFSNPPVAQLFENFIKLEGSLPRSQQLFTGPTPSCFNPEIWTRTEQTYSAGGSHQHTNAANKTAAPDNQMQRGRISDYLNL
jgi:hypothetical protein